MSNFLKVTNRSVDYPYSLASTVFLERMFVEKYFGDLSTTNEILFTTVIRMGGEVTEILYSKINQTCLQT